MNDSRNDFIKALAADLTAVSRPGDTRRAFGFWLGCAALYSLAVTLATGKFPAETLRAQLAEPAFAVQLAAAVASIVLLAHATLRSAVPDGGVWWRSVALPLIAVSVWIAYYVVGLVQSSELSFALLGGRLEHREHCFWQILLFGLPSLALLLWLARGLLPLQPRVTAALAGAAAAAVPAALMQLACTSEPLHSLAYHIMPIALTAAFGAAIGRLALMRRDAVPRMRGDATH